MDTISGSEAARRLGTSLPRVMRAIERLDVDVERGRGGRVYLTADQLGILRTELGVLKRVAGLDRTETLVLAALARAPRGLASVRAVARRADVSPTSASRAVDDLVTRGLVRRQREWVAAGGARQIEVIRAEVTAPGWPRLAPDLAKVELPTRRSLHRPARVPARLAHLFWNADGTRVRADRHGGYIADRLISSGDLDGLAWGMTALRAADWERAAQDRGLTDRQRAVAHNLARGATA